MHFILSMGDPPLDPSNLFLLHRLYNPKDKTVFSNMISDIGHKNTWIVYNSIHILFDNIMKGGWGAKPTKKFFECYPPPF